MNPDRRDQQSWMWLLLMLALIPLAAWIRGGVSSPKPTPENSWSKSLPPGMGPELTPEAQSTLVPKLKTAGGTAFTHELLHIQQSQQEMTVGHNQRSWASESPSLVTRITNIANTRWVEMAEGKSQQKWERAQWQFSGGNRLKVTTNRSSFTGNWFQDWIQDGHSVTVVLTLDGETVMLKGMVDADGGRLSLSSEKDTTPTILVLKQ